MRKQWGLIVVSFFLGMNHYVGLGQTKQRVQVVGTVAGYDQLMSLTNITAAPQLQILLVRSVRSKPETARYIKVVYRYHQSKSALPKGLFDGKTKWVFIVRRDQSCDSLWRDLKSETVGDGAVPRYKINAEKEGLQDDLSLPCYVLIRSPGVLTKDGH